MQCLFAYAESEPSEDVCELWNEQESVHELLSESDEEAPDIQVPPIQGQSKALAAWLIRFLFCIQAVFHVSDTALSFCIKFFKVFFSVLGRFCKVSTEIAECLPRSIYAAKLGINQLQFQKYVVCKKCHRIYLFSQCIQGPKTARTSKLCTFTQFPRHPQERMRRPCGTILLKSVELASGAIHLYPRLTYCYLSLEVSLQSLLLHAP